MEKMYLPVIEVDRYNNGYVEVSYGEGYDERKLAVKKSYLKTEDELRDEYSEEYRNARNYVLYEMDTDEFKAAFGDMEYSCVRSLKPSVLMAKLKEYNDSPNVGEIWETDGGDKVVISYKYGNSSRTNVVFYTPSGCEFDMEKPSFMKRYHNTGKVLAELKAFINALEQLGE